MTVPCENANGTDGMDGNLHYYLGLDPGLSGGIALINADGRVVFATATPEDDSEILRLIDPLGRQVRAALEHVWSSPGWGHVGAFTFGKSFGGLQMALAANGVPFVKVIPRTWQKALGVVYPKKATNTEKKNITKARAQALFPTTRVTHHVADALLLAEWCRRTTQVASSGKGSRRTQVDAGSSRPEAGRRGTAG